MSSQEKGWRELAIGGVILEAGNSVENPTGTWRTYRPVWDGEKCIQCLRCWILCPDSSIISKDGKVAGIDYEHCKGCGICAEECPVKAIKMILSSSSS